MHPIHPFSPITEAIVLFAWAAPFWHMLMIQLEAKASKPKIILISTFMFAWTMFAYAAIRYNADALLFDGFPGRPLAYLIMAIIVSYFLRNWLLGNRAGVSQRLLIGLQLFRPLGMLFVLEHERGILPAIFAHPAGWGDLLAGIVAAYVLIKYHGKTIPAKAVITVAVVGIADFTMAFTLGFLSSESPLQLFSHDHPNIVIDYPTGLIPLFLVPYATVAHILSLAQLQRDKVQGR